MSGRRLEAPAFSRIECEGMIRQPGTLVNDLLAPLKLFSFSARGHDAFSAFQAATKPSA